MDWTRFREVVSERFLARYPKFMMRIDSKGRGRPKWVQDEAFSLEQHITYLCPEAPMGKADLQALVSAQMGQLLDMTRPPWHLTFVDNVGEGGSAVLFRLHHAIADGISLARILFSLTDDSAEANEGEALSATKTAAAGAGSQSALSRASLSPSRVFRGALGAPIFLARTVGSLLKLLFAPADPRTCLHGELSPEKRVAWSSPIPLEDVKRVSKADGATINDVLLASVAGALGRYLEQRGTPAKNVRAFVPVNLRPLHEPIPASLGNRFGIVFLSLPVGLRSRMARLTELKRRMDAIKRSPEALLAFLLLGAVGMMPAGVEELLVRIFGKKASAVMTNVPGPRSTIYLAGVEVAGVLCWVPQSARLGLGVSILSYRGEVVVGVASDTALVPDPEVIVRGVEEEVRDALTALDAQNSGVVQTASAAAAAKAS